MRIKRRKYSIDTLIVMIVIVFIFLISCGKGDKSNVSGKQTRVNKVSENEKQDEWKILFDGTNLDSWVMTTPGSWKIEDGMMTLVVDGPGVLERFIWTKERFGNYVFDCEFNISPKGNSGIYFRVDDIRYDVWTGLEMQILDSAGKPDPDKNDCGALYDLLEPKCNPVKLAGEWNHVIITCIDNFITIDMNGERIIDMDMDKWDTPNMNPDGTQHTRNNLIETIKEFPREGYIGFQDHGSAVWFRNVRIKELQSAKEIS